MKFFPKMTIEEKHQSNILIHMLLNDALLLLLATFFMFILAESVIPGLISQNRGFLFILLAIPANIFAINHLSKKIRVEYTAKPKHKAIPFLLALSFIISGNALLNFSLWQNIVITSVALFVITTLYKLVIEEKNN